MSVPRLLRVSFSDGLRVKGGKLGEVGSEVGVAVHAASFLRKNLVVLDRGLLDEPEELARIWRHELLHFVWWRLGNPARLGWEQVLRREHSAGARGEMGWSAECRKQLLDKRDVALRTRRWREYCCESFCDTGAWLRGGGKVHRECTLAARWRNLRVRYNSERGLF